MSIRYISHMAVLLAAAFLVVATQTFAPLTVVWLTFGIAAGATVVGTVLFIFAGSTRVVPHRVLAGTNIVLGVWTVVASLIFAPATVLGLAFSSAVAFVGLSVVGLTAHELATERVVHSVEDPRTPRQVPSNESAVAA